MTMSRLGRTGIALVAATASLATVSACSGSTRAKTSSSGSSTSAASAAGSVSSSRVVAVALTSAGCRADHPSFSSGALTFAIKNTDATAATEVELLSEDRILGEQENLAPGFGGSFSLNMPPGNYTIYCPGAATEKSSLTIIGNATDQGASTTSATLAQGAKGYLGFVRGEVDTLVVQVAALNRAVQSGNVAAAQLAYIKARPYYERIEPVAESFPNLDAALDSRVDAGASVAGLTGFHRIEHDLFVTKSTAGLAQISAGLVANTAKLHGFVTKLSGFQPAELANGAKGLLDEAATTKMTGEEEKYSHVDLLDFAANVEGSQQAFAYLEPGLTKIDPTLTTQIRSAFTALNAKVARYASKTDPSGYVRYGKLTAADKTSLSASLLAVDNLLAKVAGKVVSA